MPDLTDRQKLDRRMAALKKERDGQGWKQHWQDIAETIMPRKGRFLSTDTNRGKRINDKIIDGTAMKAVRDAAAGLMAGVTSPARPWLRLAVPDPDMMEYTAVREWLDLVRDRMLELWARSNLYDNLHQIDAELLLFGTGALGSRDDRDDVLRFESFTAGEYYIANSDQGRVDTFYRDFQATVMQIVQWFVAKPNGDMDWSNVADPIKSAYDNGNTEMWVDLVHAVEPNDKRIGGLKDAKNMPFRSIYYDPADSSGKLLRVGGFKELPVFCPRWDLTGSDVYGRSPGMDALPDVKMLQVMQKRKAQAIDKMVNPPMVAPNSLRNQDASVLPGHITYVDQAGSTGSQPAFRPAYEVNPRVQELALDIQDTRQRIREHFFADLFLMISQSDRREITAEEIRARQEEKLLMLGPVLERLHKELLNPLVDRTFQAMLDSEILPPAPEELEGVPLNVEYISIMAQAQKSVGISAIESTVAFAANMNAIVPGSIDKIDIDEAIDAHANMRGVPVKIIRSDDKVAAMRGAQAKEAANAANLQKLAGAVTVAKEASQIDMEGPNAVTAVVDAARGGMPA